MTSSAPHGVGLKKLPFFFSLPEKPSLILCHSHDKCLHALSFMAIILSTFPNLGIANTKSFFSFTPKPIICGTNLTSKRHLILQTSLLCVGIGLTPQVPVALSSSSQVSPSKSLLASIENTKSWFQFYGDGFAIRVPPQFRDITEPEVHSIGRRTISSLNF